MNRERERMLDRQAVAGHLMRHQAPCLLGIAITRGDHGGDHQPQALLLELQRLRIAQRDGAALTDCQVAQVQAVAVIVVALQHDGGIAVGQRVFIACLGLPFCHNGAREGPLPQHHLHAQQHRAPGQGEAVNHLQRVVGRVDEALRDTSLQDRASQVARERDAQQGHRIPLTRRQPSVFIPICQRRCDQFIALAHLGSPPDLCGWHPRPEPAQKPPSPPG